MMRLRTNKAPPHLILPRDIQAERLQIFETTTQAEINKTNTLHTTQVRPYFRHKHACQRIKKILFKHINANTSVNEHKQIRVWRNKSAGGFY